MEMELKDLVNAKDGLIKIFNAELPIKISYKLSKLVKDLNEELNFFEEKRKKLIEKFGEKKGDKIEVKQENLELFTNEMNELLKLKVEFKFEKIQLNEIENVKLSSLEVYNLQKFIIE